MADPTTRFELKEPASPETLVPSLGLWPWWTGAGLLCVIVIAVIIALRKKPRVEDPAAARDAAFAEARQALGNIATTNARDAAVQTSLILRRYLSTAAGDPALFETHEEFVARRDSLVALHPEARSAAEIGFGRLAELKYAPEIPDLEASQVTSEAGSLLETLHHGFAT